MHANCEITKKIRDLCDFCKRLLYNENHRYLETLTFCLPKLKNKISISDKFWANFFYEGWDSKKIIEIVYRAEL